MLFSFSVILAIPKGFSGQGLVQQRLLQRLNRSALPLLEAVDALGFAGGAIAPRRPVNLNPAVEAANLNERAYF